MKVLGLHGTLIFTVQDEIHIIKLSSEHWEHALWISVMAVYDYASWSNLDLIAVVLWVWLYMSNNFDWNLKVHLFALKLSSCM